MHILYPFAKRFIAGEDLPTALGNIRSLNRKGYLSTVDLLGENTLTEAQATAAKDEYLELMRSIGDQFPLDLSLKLTQMGLNLDRELCKRNVDEIIEAAGHHTVRFDMEGSDTTPQTVDLCLELHAPHRNLGIVLQSYQFRTEKDLTRMLENGISVRLCKGAYREPPDIAYQDMDDIRQNFLKLGKRLLKEGFLPAIATHDEFLIKELLKFIRQETISPKSFYFELLYGVRRDLQKHLLDLGYQVRVYVPYGKSWLPYTLRRLAERKENILFVVKSLIRETLARFRIHKDQVIKVLEELRVYPPVRDDERSTKPTSGELCDECLAKDRNGECRE